MTETAWNPNMEDAPSLAMMAYELKRLRKVRKISLRQLAREIDISPTTQVRLERGEQPDTETSRKVMRFIGFCPCCLNPLPAPPQIKE